MKERLSAVMVLIGTFIGAGFASGQEVLQYFGVFGKFAIFGVAISCFLMGIFIYSVADNIMCMGEKEYLNSLCSHKWMKIMLNCYMLLMFSTMITAFGESVEQVWNIPKIYGVVLIDVLTCLILYFGAQGLIRFNSLVTPLIIGGIVFSFFVCNCTEVFEYNNFISSAVVYTSYNVISMPFVITGLNNMLKTKKDNIICSGIFGLVVFGLSLCMLNILKNADASVSIPLLSAVDGKYALVVVAILALSMITTAVSNGYGFEENIFLNKKITILFLGVFGIVFSAFDFSFIVGSLYRFFGIMGIYILIKNFYIFAKNREKPRKIKKTFNNRF